MRISRDPPLPLDLETPYNEETSPNNNRNGQQSSTHNDDDQYQGDQPMSINNNLNLNNIHRGILGNTFNPNSDTNIRNMIITKSNQHNRAVLTNIYDGVNGNSGSGNNLNRVNNNFTATSNNNNNYGSNVNSRSNQNIQIITKNGLTKKPNIIANDYSPDHIFAPTNKHNPSNNNNHPPYNPYNPSHTYNKHNHDFDSLNKPMTSSSLADRKSTCMLYLQADHTFL